ncbi:phosphoesterase family-domain-containing protein [Blyttiomyces helicus]|uniref:Phosphoesterase family-domain-containing protein n=1 Tax=Blyttiomyces helicus TaxID=388810 RepID=A0A4P9WKT6_9FUNG|nr:phosphoesterase family-domain-containing protein [Blyttiomyces helicus]|eukprot:RKO92643.1 phosphoesterase family-domain-containing protein [Blyttiomyces helicus]
MWSHDVVHEWKYAHPANVPHSRFDRIIVTFLENHNFTEAMNVKAYREIAKKGLLMTKYYGAVHPSQPNYIASIAGDYFSDEVHGATDEDVHFTGKKILTDLLDEAGLTWKTYQESYPGNSTFCFTESGNATVFGTEGGPTVGNSRLYKRKHNPFMSFSQIEHNTEYCTAHVFDGPQLKEDIKAGTVPNYAFYTPNMCEDGHDSDVDALKADPIEGRTSECNDFFHDKGDGRNLYMFVFDEDNYMSDQRIYAALVGSAVPEHLVGTTSDIRMSHYSIISTISANWGLPNLGRFDVDAPVFPLSA